MAKGHPKRKQGLCAAYGCSNNRSGKNLICDKHRMQKHKEGKPISYTYQLLKTNAKRRGKVFELTLKEFTKFCEETNYIELKGRRSDKMSIDRKDSSKGYTYDNIQIMNYGENSAKGNRDIDSLDELEEVEEWEDLPF